MVTGLRAPPGHAGDHKGPPNHTTPPSPLQYIYMLLVAFGGSGAYVMVMSGEGSRTA